jgi:hypothetical protein
LEKWAAELSQHFIEFEKRTSIKSQVLANFIADWTPSQSSSEKKSNQNGQYITMAHGASQGLEQLQ